MNGWKEVAKFACGFEAFHATVHAYLLLSGTSMTLWGVTTTPPLNVVGIVVNGALSLALGAYAWRNRGRRVT